MKISNSIFLGLLLLIVLVSGGLYLYIEKSSIDIYNFDNLINKDNFSLNFKNIKEQDIVGVWSWDQSPEIVFEIDKITGEHTFNSYLHCRPDSSGKWELTKEGNLVLNTDYGSIFTYKDIKILNSKISAVNNEGDQVYFDAFIEGSSVDDYCP